LSAQQPIDLYNQQLINGNETAFTYSKART
jgi:hypothetical protein